MAIKPKLRSRKVTAAERVDPSALVFLALGSQYRGTFGQRSKVAGLKSPSHATEELRMLPPEPTSANSVPSETAQKVPLPQLQSPLFQIPPELRNKIYEYCADICMHQDGVHYLLTGPLTWATCRYPALLQTCKRLNREASEIIISSEVEIRITRLGVFYKTVGIFDPASVRRARVFRHQAVSPVDMNIYLEGFLCNAHHIETMQLTNYTRNLLTRKRGETISMYRWERPKNSKKKQQQCSNDVIDTMENPNPVDLIAAVTCWHERAAIMGVHGPAHRHPHQKWKVVRLEDKSYRVRSFDLCMNLAIRRQDEWRCAYLSEKLAIALADALKGEAEMLAGSENPEMLFR